MRRDAAPAAAGGRIWRLQFTDDLLQLSRQLQVCVGAQLRPEVFQAVDGHVLPGLSEKQHETASPFSPSASHPQPSHPAGSDGVLEHAADGRGQRPGLAPQQTLHAALGR